MIEAMTPAHLAVTAIALAACLTDLRHRRIPNWLTFGAAVLGVLFSTVAGGWTGLGLSLAGWLVGFAIFFIPFALRGLGGGDLKLLAALGAWFGPYDVAWLALYTCIAGAVLAVVVALGTGYLREAFRNIWVLLIHWRLFGLRPHPELTIHETRGPKLAYGIAIFTGTMVTIWTH